MIEGTAERLSDSSHGKTGPNCRLSPRTNPLQHRHTPRWCPVGQTDGLANTLRASHCARFLQSWRKDVVNHCLESALQFCSAGVKNGKKTERQRERDLNPNNPPRNDLRVKQVRVNSSVFMCLSVYATSPPRRSEATIFFPAKTLYIPSPTGKLAFFLVSRSPSRKKQLFSGSGKTTCSIVSQTISKEETELYSARGEVCIITKGWWD